MAWWAFSEDVAAELFDDGIAGKATGAAKREVAGWFRMWAVES